ncbi:MAG: hypothetical protein ABH851_06165 [Methanobacteriota archaeon]
MTKLEVDFGWKDAEKFIEICGEAKIKPNDLIHTFIRAVVEYYSETPQLLREFSGEKFFPAPIMETVYRFNEKTEKIERLGLTGKGKLLKLEEATPKTIKSEVESMQDSLRHYFKYLGEQ